MFGKTAPLRHTSTTASGAGASHRCGWCGLLPLPEDRLSSADNQYVARAPASWRMSIGECSWTRFRPGLRDEMCSVKASSHRRGHIGRELAAAPLRKSHNYIFSDAGPHACYNGDGRRGDRDAACGGTPFLKR
jgi:hypothetical protein